MLLNPFSQFTSCIKHRLNLHSLLAHFVVQKFASRHSVNQKSINLLRYIPKEQHSIYLRATKCLWIFSHCATISSTISKIQSQKSEHSSSFFKKHHLLRKSTLHFFQHIPAILWYTIL